MTATATPTTTHRVPVSRRHLVVVALLLAALSTVFVPPAEAQVDSGAEAQFVQLINQERASRGLPALRVASDLVGVARSHSQEMAAAQDLYHNPELATDVRNWQKVGENVGRGPSVARIHAAFMASSGHAANILHPDWTEVGVGVEVVDGRVWVTEVFRLPAGSAQPAAQPTPQEPVPAPTATPTASSATSGSTASAPRPETTTAAAAPAAVAPAAEAAPVDEAAAPIPLALDRTTVTLARLEAAETHTPVAAHLER